MKKTIVFLAVGMLFAGCGLKVLPYDAKFTCGGDPKKLGSCGNAVENMLYAERVSRGEATAEDMASCQNCYKGESE